MQHVQPHMQHNAGTYDANVATGEASHAACAACDPEHATSTTKICCMCYNIDTLHLQLRSEGNDL